MNDRDHQLLVDQVLADHDVIFRTLRAEWSKEIFAADLTLPQMRLLFLLDRYGEMSMSQLAEALGRTLPTISGLTDRLVEQGLVQRATSAEDRRVIIASLTESGRELFENLSTAWVNHTRNLLEGLGDDELRRVADGIRILRGRAALQTEAAEVAAP